jgi:hypothetical protein
VNESVNSVGKLQKNMASFANIPLAVSQPGRQAQGDEPCSLHRQSNECGERRHEVLSANCVTDPQ